MTKIRLACLAAALAWAAAAGAAALLTPEEIKAQKVRIEEQYDSAQMRCRRLQSHARELCNEEARGERDIQAAELRMRAEPTAENDHKLRLARAEAGYSVALIECKPLAGASRKVCRQDAKRVLEEAKTEAKLQQQVMALQLRAESTVRERNAQAERVAAAQYASARQRCELLPAEGRANCLEDAQRRFGR